MRTLASPSLFGHLAIRVTRIKMCLQIMEEARCRDASSIGWEKRIQKLVPQHESSRLVVVSASRAKISLGWYRTDGFPCCVLACTTYPR